MRHLYIPTMSNEQIRKLAANALESMTKLYFTINRKYPAEEPDEPQEERRIPMEFEHWCKPPVFQSRVYPGCTEYWAREKTEPRFKVFNELGAFLQLGSYQLGWSIQARRLLRKTWSLCHNGQIAIGMLTKDGSRSKCLIRDACNVVRFADDYVEDYSCTPDTYEWKIMRGEIIENLEQDRYDYWKKLTHNLAKLNIDWRMISDQEARKLIERNGAWCLIHKDRICVGIKREGCYEHCIIDNIRESMDLVPTSKVCKIDRPESPFPGSWKNMKSLPGH